MNLPLPEPRRSWPGLIVNSAVALIVLAVAAGMFMLSYAGVHALAQQAGVSAQLARFYPALFDAVLVIACVAAIMLRDGRWWARYWAWLVIIIVLAAIGATDVAHAVKYALPHRQTDAIVAAAPLVAVLLAFSLLLALLGHSRGQAAVPARSRREARRAAEHPPTLPVHALSPADEAGPQAARPPAPAIALPAAAGELRTPTESVRVVVLEPAPTRADPVPAEVAAEPPVPVESQERPAEPGTRSGQAAPAEEAGTPDEQLGHAAEPGTPDGQAGHAPEPGTPDEQPGHAAEPATPDGQAGHAPEPATADELAGPAAEPAGYWETDPRLAGLAYQAEPPEADEVGEPDADTGPEEAPSEREAGSGMRAPTVDEDASPFATAPFATVPRLNRVRATPTPPEDEED